MGNRVAVVGVGQTHHSGHRFDVSFEEMLNEAVRAALEDAKISINEIDAVLTTNMDPFEGRGCSDTMCVGEVGSYLKAGVKPQTGGTSGATVFSVGWTYAASGLFDTVLIVGGEKQEEIGGDSQMGIITAVDEFTLRPVYTGALGGLAMLASKYIAETGCPEEIAALERTIMDENALGNPYAHLRLGITIDDVLNSPMLIYPVRLLHMSPQSNGATALILAAENKAKRITNKPVWVKDVVTVHHSGFIRFLSGLSPDPSSHEVAAIKLYKRNGITDPLKEIDMFEIYDPCIWEQIIWLEDFLLLERGAVPKLIEKGVTRRDGAFPVSPSGGVVCTNDIGATGLTRFAEAALQIRRDAGDHQVTKNVNLAMVSGWGAANWTILGLLSKSIN